jgi:hypothetical protein
MYLRPVRYPGDESKVIMERERETENKKKSFCNSQSFLPVLSYKLQK